MENNEFVIERISDSEKEVTIYFKVAEERYFLAVGIEKSTSNFWVFIENANKCYLTATSEILSLEELSKFTNLKYSEGWSKGDLRKNGKSKHTFSRISFEILDSESYSTEEALGLLLEYLSKHKEEIISLSKKSNAYISVCKYQYISANAGLHLDKTLIGKLNELNLPIDIDTYICGNPIT